MTKTYKLGDLQITLDEQGRLLSAESADGTPLAPKSDEMPAYAAAIALALIEHEVEEVHDPENNHITIQGGHSPWGTPQMGTAPTLR